MKREWVPQIPIERSRIDRGDGDTLIFDPTINGWTLRRRSSRFRPISCKGRPFTIAFQNFPAIYSPRFLKGLSSTCGNDSPPELAVSSCSRCLAEDLVTGRSAYIRQIWVMACVSFCPRHKWPLTSHCGACKSSLWRWQRPPRGPVRLQCGECLRSLGRAHGEALGAAGPTIEAWLLLTDFEQELLAVAAGRVPNQFKYNATSTRQFINQVRDILPVSDDLLSSARALFDAGQPVPLAGAIDCGKAEPLTPSSDAFPLHTAEIACRRSLLALCAALVNSRVTVGACLFPGRVDQLLRNFAERRDGASPRAICHPDDGRRPSSLNWTPSLNAHSPMLTVELRLSE